MNTEIPQPVEANSSATMAVAPQEKVVELIPSVIQMKNILVPLDFTEMSLKALRYAVPFCEAVRRETHARPCRGGARSRGGFFISRIA
jgi:hypothetical protein